MCSRVRLKTTIKRQGVEGGGGGEGERGEIENEGRKGGL